MSVPDPSTTKPLPLRLTQVASGRGATWVRQGLQVYLRKPLAFTAMLVAVLVASVVISLIGRQVGVILMLIYLPMLTLASMMATQSVLQGGSPSLQHLILPLRGDARRRMRLLQLGGLYAVSTVLILVIAGWVDDGAMDALEKAIGAEGDNDAAIATAMGDPRLMLGMLVRLTLTTLLAVPFWHSPALVWWGNQGVAQSLFSSTLACWRARGAFLVYGLAWSGLGFGATLALMLVFGLLGNMALLTVGAIPIGLIVSTAFYASLYFTFADSFSAQPPAGDAPPATDSVEAP